jgi:hypothetical protein
MDTAQQLSLPPAVGYGAHRYGQWGYIWHTQNDVAGWIQAANAKIADKNAHWHGPVMLFDEEAMKSMAEDLANQRARADNMEAMLARLVHATRSSAEKAVKALREKAGALIRTQGAASPLREDPEVTKTVTRRHVTRLRHYFARAGGSYIHRLDGIDLDLLGQGLVKNEPNNFSGGSVVSLTDKGVKTLHAHRQADIENRNGHHSLGNRVAAMLRAKGRMTWENVELRHKRYTKGEGQNQINYEHFQYVRPDVFSIEPTLKHERANPCVHEIKVSRADFLTEMAKPEKREAYAGMAEAVYFVAPEGIIKPEEVPDGCGLLVEAPSGEFKLLKRPRKRKVVLEPWHYLAMVLKRGQPPGDNE